MTTQELLQAVEEGVQNGRISAYLAAYIASEILGVDAHSTGYDERVRLDDDVRQDYAMLTRRH